MEVMHEALGVLSQGHGQFKQNLNFASGQILIVNI